MEWERGLVVGVKQDDATCYLLSLYLVVVLQASAQQYCRGGKAGEGRERHHFPFLCWQSTKRNPPESFKPCCLYFLLSSSLSCLSTSQPTTITDAIISTPSASQPLVSWRYERLRNVSKKPKAVWNCFLPSGKSKWMWPEDHILIMYTQTWTTGCLQALLRDAGNEELNHQYRFRNGCTDRVQHRQLFSCPNSCMPTEPKPLAKPFCDGTHLTEGYNSPLLQDAAPSRTKQRKLSSSTSLKNLYHHPPWLMTKQQSTSCGWMRSCLLSCLTLQMMLRKLMSPVWGRRKRPKSLPQKRRTQRRHDFGEPGDRQRVCYTFF